MHQAEVEQQIKYDYQKFLDEPYNRNVPENILDLFEKAIMVLPPFFHKVQFTKVKSIINKTPETLTNSDLNEVIKVVVNCSLQQLYDSLYDAIPEMIKLDSFILKFNTHIQEFQEKLNQKRKRLEELSDGVLKTGAIRSMPNGKHY